MTFSNAFLLKEKLYILIPLSLKFVPKGSIDNKSALARVMAWRIFVAKPLPKSMMTQSVNAYMRQQSSRIYASFGLNKLIHQTVNPSAC